MAAELRGLFEEADADGNGRLSEKEFTILLNSQKLQTYLRYLDIDPAWMKDNLPTMFQMLAMEEKVEHHSPQERIVEIETSHFVHRCMSLRGSAKSTEIMEIHNLLLRTHEQ